MSKEKVYGGSFDGSHRYIVRSTSWERATVALQACGLNVSVHAARSSGSISGNVQEQMMTRDHLDAVFRRPCNCKGDWERVPRRGALANEDRFIAAIEAELGRSIEDELSRRGGTG